MLDNQTQEISKEEAKFFGLDNGLSTYSPYPFGTMNQEDSRQGMQDNELYWCENLIRVGNGKMRALWDRGPSLYTAPAGKTIVYYYFYNIGTTDYVAVFLSDGTAVQVDMSGTVTVISSTVNLLYNGGQLPACGQWGSTYLLICNNISSNGYFIWDGSDFHQAGTIAPNVVLQSGGSGYTSSPSVTAFGGHGTGASFSAQVINGSVTSVSVTNTGTGYVPGDVVQLYFSGGGSDNGIELLANITAGTIASIVLLNGGTGYTAGTYALGFSGGGGTGAAGTYTVDASTSVVSVALTNGGSGYTGSPSVTFPSGGGSGASAIANLSAGTVTSVTVVHGGTNLTGTPTLTFVGGNGSGATATAVLTSGSISSVTVTNGGSGYTSAPAVEAQAGLNNAAYATVALMPFKISGSAIETFQQRVWIFHPFQQLPIVNGAIQTGNNFNVSSPGSFTDFASSDGGVQFTNTDAFLRKQYVNARQSNGYLYTFGDSSVSTVSNVQSSTNTTTGAISTTFNYQCTDPQIGTSWRDSLQAYGLSLLFANNFGVFGLYGGFVKKVSDKIDSIFTNAIFPPTAGAITPVGALCNLYSKKVYLLLLTIRDPFTEQLRNAMVAWDEKDWFICSQSANLTFIAVQEVNSNLTAWGTDGKNLFPMFNTPSQNINKKISTKLYGQEKFLVTKQALGVYMQTQELSAANSGVKLSAVMVDSETGTYNIPSIPTIPVGGVPYFPIVSMGSGDVFGQNLGVTVTTTSPDFTLNYLGLSTIDVSSIAMTSTPIHGQIDTQ